MDTANNEDNSLKNCGITVRVMDFSWNKYKAACWLNYLWNKRDIDNKIISIGDKNES